MLQMACTVAVTVQTTRKIKLRSVGLRYANGVDRRSAMSLYRSTPSLSKYKQLNWPELMLPIKLFQFKICQLAVTDSKNQAQGSRPMLCEQY